MLYKKTILLSLFLLMQQLLKSQEYRSIPDLRIGYEFIFQTDSTDTKSKKSEIMNLFLAKDKSIFESNTKYKYDSIVSNYIKLNSKIIDFDAIQKPQVWISIFKDFNNNELIYSDRIMKYKLFYQSNIDKIQWKLLSETKIILGYKSKKAICHFRGRNYIAWYTEKIPITDGPYKFNGLPGLILSIADTSNQFSFNAILISRSKNKEISMNINSNIKTSREKYYFDKIKIIKGLKGNNGRSPIINLNPIEKI
ncbi:GLPGLI family protein [Elizabethkingia anophelis]|nr:GLPGLI family protein [Elizabethkingia anophelis]MCT4062832.1 GLPGLI family protein [Elizabethkingia anophelis]MCT4109123.1 GLPGLI family protein [Elizabethkingia anophelis]